RCTEGEQLCDKADVCEHVCVCVSTCVCALPAPAVDFVEMHVCVHPLLPPGSPTLKQEVGGGLSSYVGSVCISVCMCVCVCSSHDVTCGVCVCVCVCVLEV